MLYRLAAIAFGIWCLATIIMLVLISESKGADFEGDWRLEQLTCDELVSGYKFGVATLEDIQRLYNDCNSYYKDRESPPHGGLHCAMIKKEGLYVMGMVNDMVNVYNIKCTR